MANAENKTEYQVIDDVTVLKPICEDIIKNYCYDLELDGLLHIPPTVWTDILQEIKTKIIDPSRSRLLKNDTPCNNEYNLESVYYLYEDIYKRLCNKYIQEITLKDFVTFSGIDKQSIYNFSSKEYTSNHVNHERLSTFGFDFSQKINSDSEKSTYDCGRSSGKNPMLAMAKLNRYHGWNGSGTVAEKKAIATRTPEQIAAEYGQNTAQIAQKPLELPDV